METKQNSQFTSNDGNTNSGIQNGQPTGKQSASQSEETLYDGSQAKGTSSKQAEKPSKNSKGQSHIGTIAGTAGGILLGGVAGAFLSSFTTDAPDVHPDNHHDTPIQPESDTPVWSDGEVPIAHSVNDDMSFSEAFAAARAEVGPGGAFEWHGNVYGTYYAEEWNAMTEEEQLAYEDHFNWSANHTDDDSQNHGNDVTGNPDSENLITDNTVTPEDDVIVEPTPADNEVEILGVVHDDSTGYDVGGVVVDGQEVLLVDVNTDGTFDYAVADTNGDGQISDDEIADISQEGLAVSDLEQAAAADEGAMLASNDGMPDYVNDADVNSLA